MEAATALRVLKMIYGALAFGVLIFAGIATVVGGKSGGDYPNQILSGIAAFVLLLAIGVGPWVARKLSGVNAEETNPPERRLQQYVGFKILSAAFVEGAGMMWAVIVFLSGSPLASIGAGIAALTILTRIPNASDLEAETGIAIPTEEPAP